MEQQPAHRPVTISSQVSLSGRVSPTAEKLEAAWVTPSVGVRRRGVLLRLLIDAYSWFSTESSLLRA
jgi:hypothetical protein